MEISPRDVVHFSQARVILAMIDEAEKGLVDVKAGRVTDAKAALRKIKKHRATAV